MRKKKIEYKEHFTDEKTGEIVKRVEIEDKYLSPLERQKKDIDATYHQLAQLNIQLMMLKDNLDKIFEKYRKVQKEFNEFIIYSREKMHLDSSWLYNIELKVFEKREPPAVEEDEDEGIE